MDFAILGPVTVRQDGRVLPVGGPRERFVLATLLLNADRVTTRDRLLDPLWEVPPSSAKAQLHNIIGRVRRALGSDGLIVTRPSGYELKLGSHRLDLLEFRGLVEQGRQAVADGDHTRAAELFSRATGLWRGTALEDVPVGLDYARVSLLEERLSATEAQLSAEVTLGRHDEALRELAGLLVEHPYRERLYELRMIALAETGQRAAALETYHQAYRRFVEELGVEPGRSLGLLEQRILRGEALIPAGQAAERPVPRQLPAAPAILTGRDKLAGEVSETLRHVSSPVAVLTGPGGVGKTAVALHCAHRVTENFPDGQLYADLGGVRDRPADPQAVLGRFLRAMGVGGADLPEDPDERVAMYRSMLAGTRTMVVLDDAADEGQVRPLVPGSASCATLVTSRRRLGALVGAARWTVPVLSEDDAVQLLASIVGQDRLAAEPDAAGAIVGACGLLPLSTAIAAARLAVSPHTTLAQFQRRLTAERHRLDELSIGDLDVRATIATSYEALDAIPRRMFRLLGLIDAPDWPEWIVNALAEPGSARSSASVLDELVDRHLVEPFDQDGAGQRRFRLHDLVALFARERMLAECASDEQDAALTRVVTGWLALVTVADEQIAYNLVPPLDIRVVLAAPPDAETLARTRTREWFEAERRSLLSAVESASRLGLPAIAGSLALRASSFLSLRAYHRDCDRILRLAISCARDHNAAPMLARLLGALFHVTQRVDRYDELPGIAAEHLSVADRLGDRAEQIRALTNSGLVAIRQSRFADAQVRAEQAVAMSRHPDVDDSSLCDALSRLAFSKVNSGHAAEAVPILEETLDIDRRSNKPLRTALHLYHYGMALTALGRLAEAESALIEGLQMHGAVGYEFGSAYIEQALADVDIRLGRNSVAAERLHRARQWFRRYPDSDGLAETLRTTGDLAAAEGRWDDSITAARGALDIWRRIESPVEIVRTLARLERAYTATGDPARADACRQEYEAALTDLQLDEHCLALPPIPAA